MHRALLTIPQILKWADTHYARTGKWPKRNSGRVVGLVDESWNAVHLALRNCGRGLHVPGMSLPRLLFEARGVRNRGCLPKLTVRQILAWTVAHYDRMRTWPTNLSGPILEAPGETWHGVDKALRTGGRGLPGDSSLFEVMVKAHRIRLHRRIPAPTTDQILDWAKSYFERHKKVPTQKSGRIPGTRGITWGAIQQALQNGYRGLPGGSSLSLFLDGHFPVRSRHPPPLTVEEILRWARLWHRRHGKWPNARSPGLAGTSGVTWGAIHQALREGYRGLPGGSSLAKLLSAERAEKGPSNIPPDGTHRTGSKSQRRVR